MSNIYYSIVLTIQVLSAIAVIGLVLVQHGKGADMGAAFGSGASGSLFGATGSANFLSRSTAVAAGLFFATTLGLAWLSNSRTVAPRSIMDQVTPPVSAPATKGIAVPPAGTAPSTSGPAATVPPAAVVAPATSVAPAATAVPASVPAVSVPPAVAIPPVSAPAASKVELPKVEAIKIDPAKGELSKDAPK